MAMSGIGIAIAKAMARSKDTRILITTLTVVDSLTFTILKLKPSGVYQTSYSNVFTPRSSSEFAAIFGRDFLAPPNPIRIIAPGHLVGGLLTSYSTYNSV